MKEHFDDETIVPSCILLMKPVLQCDSHFSLSWSGCGHGEISLPTVTKGAILQRDEWRAKEGDGCTLRQTLLVLDWCMKGIRVVQNV